MNIFPQLFTIVLAGIALPTLAGEKIKQTLPASDASVISVDNLRGKVAISGWQQDQVAVEGELDDKAEKFIFEQDGNQIRIKVIMPRHLNDSWRERGSNLVIKVPQAARVTFNGVSTDVEIENLHKSSEVRTVSGNITATNLDDKVELSTVSGDITSKQLAGKISLATISGEINDRKSSGRLQLKAVSGKIKSDSTAAEIQVNNVSGDTELTLANIDELQVSSVSGDVDSRFTLSTDGSVKMSSVSGDLAMKFNGDVQASFKLSSNAGGNIRNGLTAERAQKPKYGPSAKLSFETGNANGSVKASTVSGSITVSDN